METDKANALIQAFTGDTLELGRYGESWKKILALHGVENGSIPYNKNWDWFMGAAKKVEGKHKDIGSPAGSLTFFRDKMMKFILEFNLDAANWYAALWIQSYNALPDQSGKN